MKRHTFVVVFHVLCNLQYLRCTDFTYAAFGSNTENVSPAAFGDFNSDELTDLFIINNNSSGNFVQILLGSPKEPYFTPADSNLICSHPDTVGSVVPGDFDGDGLMDVLVTVYDRKANIKLTVMNVYVHWGEYHDGKSFLNCTDEKVLQTSDEPLAITYRTDLRTDIFALNYKGEHRMVKTIFRLSKNGTTQLQTFDQENKLKFPHSHAFIDMNEDNYADIVLTNTNNISVYTYVPESSKFEYKEHLSFLYPENMSSTTNKEMNFGQLLFLDLESSNKMYPVLPVIRNAKLVTEDTSIWVYSFESKHWSRLPVNFEDPQKNTWSFNYYKVINSYHYMDIPTLRAGDFNNDGFVDLLATLRFESRIKTFLLENAPCSNCQYSRTFVVQWDQLSPNNEMAVMGVFFDFMQDGILDVIFVQFVKGRFAVSAYKNSLDYDANFIKVMVISGIDNMSVQLPTSSILGKKHFFGSNLPGPKISYRTTNQDGIPQYGCTSQLVQSAHFALNLPYTIFGLGRSPNFVEDLIIGMFNQTKQISPIIPNSQLVIRIPNSAATDPSKWRAQLFVTPSKIIWQTGFALTGTCVVLAIIIGLLHWKERREDKTERLRESQRGFHFDAM